MKLSLVLSLLLAAAAVSSGWAQDVELGEEDYELVEMDVLLPEEEGSGMLVRQEREDHEEHEYHEGHEEHEEQEQEEEGSDTAVAEEQETEEDGDLEGADSFYRRTFFRPRFFYRSMVSVDISDVVVRQMQQKHAAAGMTFTKMDLMKLEFPDKEFTCVLDKGTLDAVYTHDDQETAEKVETMFKVRYEWTG
ncbi:Methyltransferase-like protein 13 [Amphibalanus amphitrite]|uniref:Methyltransferase-like protein 13 n=1 Tax=Amphibalanus amphitrite TaxID=1232801 RepID=A0A6A4X3J3_AMPAM|nr:Methyltransferase-like protein 13 [Amphibalanus amphitrite]